MANCATHIKRIDPVSGVVKVYDTATGLEVTDAAIIAALTCCPDRKPDFEEVCVQPIGNTDPALVESGWILSVVEVSAAGEATVVSTGIYSADKATDLTATHEVTDCPNSTPIDVALCLPA